MKGKEFSQIRHYLGKSQAELARLLCVSTRAIQSFEGEWRKIPGHAERQLLFLLTQNNGSKKSDQPCWEIWGCPDELKQKCSAYEFDAGEYCWFINGTYCHGEYQGNWKNKMELCRKCKVFISMIPPLLG